MTRARRGLLGIALAVGIAASPASALGGTISNGNYTAAPGEGNVVSAGYDAATGSYLYFNGPYTDGDGPGGCDVSAPNRATCPAVPAITINLEDGNDFAGLFGLMVPFPDGPSGPALLLAGSIPAPATIHGGDGSDLLNGGLGMDQLYAGPGSDRVFGTEALPPTGFGPAPPTSPEIQVPDVLSCGTGGGGDDASDPASASFDRAIPGPTDQVNIDCEGIEKTYTCPAGGEPCQGELAVEGTAAGGSASAAAVAVAKKKKKRKSRTVTLGTGTFKKLAPGESKHFSLALDPAGLQRVLSGRLTAPAEMVVRLKTKGKKKKPKKSVVRLKSKKKKKKNLVVAERTRFVLAKG